MKKTELMLGILLLIAVILSCSLIWLLRQSDSETPTELPITEQSE
jgi:hypothetical protein